MTPAERRAALEYAAERRILVLDGAMGTMIQAHAPAEADYRGGRFADWPSDLKGNNDLLTLTQPALIADIHRAFLDAGCDIIETNTFNSTTISQADYRLESVAYELNVEAARLARRTADAATERTPDRPRFVAGAIGPTNRTASLSPDVNNPAFRNITFDTLQAAYGEAARGLIAGGVDLLLVETVFDTLNAKAALYAIDEVFEETGALPVIVSGTITDRSGRTLSGQTPEAFWNSIRHARPFAVGLNCALGPDLIRPYVAELARTADTRISVYANAGLPNALGGYDETPESMSAHAAQWARDGLINIVGGCCGTTPEHIRAISEAVASVPPRPVPLFEPRLRLAGLEPFELQR